MVLLPAPSLHWEYNGQHRQDTWRTNHASNGSSRTLLIELKFEIGLYLAGFLSRGEICALLKNEGYPGRESEIRQSGNYLSEHIASQQTRKHFKKNCQNIRSTETADYNRQHRQDTWRTNHASNGSSRTLLIELRFEIGLYLAGFLSLGEIFALLKNKGYPGRESEIRQSGNYCSEHIASQQPRKHLKKNCQNIRSLDCSPTKMRKWSLILLRYQL